MTEEKRIEIAKWIIFFLFLPVTIPMLFVGFVVGLIVGAFREGFLFVFKEMCGPWK